jgi:hypothetical protein
MIVLPYAVWRKARDAHKARTEPWVAPRRARRATGDQHPVDDFLFEYYPFSATRLQTWHPGFGITLAGTDVQLMPFLKHPDYHQTPQGVTVSAQRLRRHAPRLRLVRTLLRGVSERPLHAACFGMHEWAMVYGAQPSQIRHQSVPLRLSPEAIRQTVDDVGLRCTHIDAYRFFTEEATPKNDFRPTRQNQPELDQAGCLHVNMDLYKYAMWFSPFIGSERVADAFAIARAARDLDMRAAPYDLTEYGYEPIVLETTAGRQQYATEQRALAERAAPIRRALLTDIEGLTAAITNEAEPSLDSKSQPDPMPA